MATGDQVIDIGLTGRKKILVAEDEQNIAALLEDWLSETYDVILAYNGAAALQKAKWNKPDVLIMDIVMPDTGGYEVVCALQGDAVTAKIPVIVMTAKNFDDSTVKLIKAEPNVYGFLNKPFKPDDLRKQIVDVMEGKRTFNSPAPSRRPGPSPVKAAPPPQAPGAPLPAADQTLPPTPAAVLPPPAGFVSPPAPSPIPAAPPPDPGTIPIPMTDAPPAAPRGKKAPAPAWPPTAVKGEAVQPPPPPPPLPQAPAPAWSAPPPPPPPVVSAPTAPPPPLPPAWPPTGAPVPTPGGVQGLVHGFPEIVPTDPLPPAPGPVPPTALPPFLKAAPVSGPRAVPPPPPVVPPAIIIEPTGPVPVSVEPSLVPHEAPVQEAPPAPKVLPRVQTLDEDDSGSAGASAFLFRAGFWVLKLSAKALILAAAVLMSAELTCRWTEEALGRELFLPPLRPARDVAFPYTFAPNSLWRQGGVSYAFNPWGLRGPEIPLIKPSGTTRIFVLGGSSVFGGHVPFEDTVTERLKSILSAEKGAGHFEVINGGLWGYSPEEQWAFYEKELAELRPDVLVWLMEEKDGGYPSSENLKALARSGVLSSGFLSASHFARLVKSRQLMNDLTAPRSDFYALQKSAARFCAESKTAFYFLPLPARELPSAEWEELPERNRIDVGAGLRNAFIGSRGSSSVDRKFMAEAVHQKLISASDVAKKK